MTATEAIAQYLRKAVKAKAEPRTPIRQVLHFAGRSYNSDAFQARIDEKVALQEQFPRLGAEHGTRIDCVNFNRDKVVRSRLKAPGPLPSSSIMPPTRPARPRWTPTATSWSPKG